MDSKALNELNNAISQLGSLSHYLNQYHQAAQIAKQALLEAANAEAVRDAATAAVKALEDEREQVAGEVAALRAELADLAAKKAAALKRALEAIEDLR